MYQQAMIVQDPKDGLSVRVDAWGEFDGLFIPFDNEIKVPIENTHVVQSRGIGNQISWLVLIWMYD